MADLLTESPSDIGAGNPITESEPTASVKYVPASAGNAPRGGAVIVKGRGMVGSARTIPPDLTARTRAA